MEFPVTLRAQPSGWAESIRPQLLRTINRLRPAFTIEELANALPSQRLRDIRQFLERLVKSGELRQDGAVFAIEAPLAVPHESNAARKQQQLWNILRGSQGRPSIDVESLAMLASTAQIRISKAEAARYVSALLEGRFLRERAPGRYWLPPDRNMGPQAPRLMEVRFLIEPNNWTIGRDLQAQEARL